MMPEPILNIRKYAQGPCRLFCRQRYTLRLDVKVAICKNSKAQDYIAQKFCGSFTAQFIHMLGGNIALAATSLHNIQA
jgi:hypothetical protein